MTMKNTTTTSIAQRKTDLMIQTGFFLLIAGVISFFCMSSAFAQISDNTAFWVSAQDVCQPLDSEQKSDEKLLTSQPKTVAATEANEASILPLTFERGGLDKASEHLQILQQATPHFVDNLQLKKPVSIEKKLQAKPQSNS